MDELQDALGDKSFSCHKTVNYDARDDEDADDDADARAERRDAGPGELHCAGALILQEKTGRPSAMMRLGEALGLYDPSALKMDAPVYGSWRAMRDAVRR